MYLLYLKWYTYSFTYVTVEVHDNVRTNVRTIYVFKEVLFHRFTWYKWLILLSLKESLKLYWISLQNPATGLIVLSGCGTSGRIGFLTAVSYK